MKKSAVIVIDCWDKHWDKDAQKSLDEGCPKINLFLHRMRKKGSIIFHCASDVIPKKAQLNNTYFFKKRNKLDIFKELKSKNPPIELDAPGPKVWKSIHPTIEQKPTDIKTVDVYEIYNTIKQNNIEKLYYVGYHANICLLWTRPFSIMQMKSNFDGEIFLVEDLTDWFGGYTKDVKTFYEKHVCKFINSENL